MKKVIITGGGTGGHLIPAIELAKLFDNNDYEVELYASSKGNDKSILKKQNLDFKVKFFNLRGFQRKLNLKGIVSNIINLFKLIYLLIRSLFILLKNKPELVIGTGGYVEFPLVFVAQKLKIKTIIYEQNSVPGMTNKILGKNATKIGVMFNKTTEYFPKEKVFFASNPVVLRIDKKIFENTYEFDVLFVGGSLGSEIINERAYEYAKENPKKKIKLIKGTKNNQLNNQLDNLEEVEYEEDILNSFSKSEIVITRGGASTLAELITLNKKTIAIPSPNVVANHQMLNCLELNDLENFQMISEDDFTLDTLTENISKLTKKQSIKEINIKYYDIIKYLNEEFNLELSKNY